MDEMDLRAGTKVPVVVIVVLACISQDRRLGAVWPFWGVVAT